MSQADEAPDVNPLFVALTRPPMIWGVPMVYLGINFIIWGVGFIGFADLLAKALFFVFVNIPIHVFGYVMTERDPHWMRIIMVTLYRCGPTPNRRFWRAQSYMP